MKAGQHMRLINEIENLLSQLEKEVSNMKKIMDKPIDARAVMSISIFQRKLGCAHTAIFLLWCEAVPSGYCALVNDFLEKSLKRFKNLETI